MLSALAIRPLEGYFRARSHFQLAQKALDQEELEEARNHLEQCLELWNQRPDIHLMMARIARLEDAHDEAERHLKKCAELGYEKNEELELEKQLLKAQGEPEIMVPALLRRAKNNPREAPAILEALARGYLNCFNPFQAMESLNMLLGKAPNHSRAYYLRGLDWERLEQKDKALKDYQKALELAPGLSKARLRLADLLYHEGRVLEAISHYEFLRQQSPHQAEVLFGLARCRFDVNQPKEAGALLDTLLTNNPRNIPALVEAGRIALQEKRPEDALPFLDKAAMSAPHNRKALVWKLRCLTALGRNKEAGQCRKQLQLTESTIMQTNFLVEKAKKNPRDAVVRHEIGKLMLTQGLEQEAISWFYAALGEDPNYLPAHGALAEYFQAAGQNFRAAPHQKASGQSLP